MSGKIRRFKRYPKYKDSGVVRPEELPAHWKVTVLKRIGDLQAGAGFPENEQGLQGQEIPFFKVGDMVADGNDREMIQSMHSVAKTTAKRLGASIFPPKTIIFAKVGAALLLNRRRILSQPSCLDNNMMGFAPGSCDPGWAFYWLCDLDLGELANPGAVPSVNEGQMRDTPVPVPPLSEQRAIARFLDREIARIDVLIGKKAQLIALLQEARRALLTRTVTKGLDPKAPMRESGVEWLGDIPAHWRVTKMWAATDAVGGATPSKENPNFWDGGIPWVSPKDMKRRFIDSSENTVSNLAFGKSTLKLVPSPAVLIVVRGMILAHSFPVGLTQVPVTINQDMKALRLREDLEPEFFAYWLDGVGPNLLSLLVDEAAHGTKAIRMDKWRVTAVQIPPRQEQCVIVSFLDKILSDNQRLTATVVQAVQRLQALRTSLISAAVTGKIDVREEVA